MKCCLKRKKQSWVLVYWPETHEISVVAWSDIQRIIKPEYIKVGWTGDLPWIDENDQTTLYEATLLKVSKNRDYIESIVVDYFGRILKPELSPVVMAAKRVILKEKKAKKAAETVGLKKLDNNTLQCLDISKPIEESSLNTEDAMLLEEKNCEKCAKCICNDLNLQLTMEFVQSLKAHVDTLSLMLSKKYPTMMQEMKGQIELHPGTKVMISPNDLTLALSKANKKKRAIIRNLFEKIASKEDIQEFKTEKKFTKQRPNIQAAIIGFVTHRYNTEISTTEYNDIINRKMREMLEEWKLDEKKSENEDPVATKKCEGNEQTSCKTKKRKQNLSPRSQSPAPPSSPIVASTTSSHAKRKRICSMPSPSALKSPIESSATVLRSSLEPASPSSSEPESPSPLEPVSPLLSAPAPPSSKPAPSSSKPAPAPPSSSTPAPAPPSSSAPAPPSSSAPAPPSSSKPAPAPPSSSTPAPAPPSSSAPAPAPPSSSASATATAPPSLSSSGSILNFPPYPSPYNVPFNPHHVPPQYSNYNEYYYPSNYNPNPNYYPSYHPQYHAPPYNYYENSNNSHINNNSNNASNNDNCHDFLNL